MLERTNLIGAITAVAFFVSAILVFTFRLLGKPQYGHWIGYLEFLLAIPLVFLLVTAPQLERPALYYIQIGCMLAWLLVEAMLDYILKIDFRQVRWMVIVYENTSRTPKLSRKMTGANLASMPTGQLAEPPYLPDAHIGITYNI